MERYSNTGHVEVFQVGLKWILDAGVQLIANTSKLHVAGTEILFIYALRSHLIKFHVCVLV